MTRATLLAAFAAALSTLPCSSQDAPAPDGGAGQAIGHAILISCDGLRPDAVTTLGREGAPTLHRIMEEGAFTLNARTDADYTVTLPNHTCMITGRGVTGDAGHGWTKNSTPALGQNLHRNKNAYVAGMFDVAHDHGMRTALYASKVKFSLFDTSYSERIGEPDTTGEDNGRDKIDRYVFEDDIDVLIDAFLADLGSAAPGLAMIHLRDTDTQGHAHGWDLTPGSPYLTALTKEDALIGRILDAVNAHPDLSGKTAVIVTTDHGGRMATKTHTNSKHRNNYTIPFFVWGAGVAPGGELYALNPETRADPGEEQVPYDAEAQPVRNGDAGNLALSLLGLPATPGSFINSEHDLNVAPLAATGAAASAAADAETAE